MRYVFKLLKSLAVTLASIIALAVLVFGARDLYQGRKYADVISLDIVDTINGCEEGCRDYIVKSVSVKSFSWLLGETVNVLRYSPELTNGLPKEWYDQSYKVLCVTGRLHKNKDDLYFWFNTRDVYNFTGSAVHPGMCSNPNAKRFKGQAFNPARFFG
jgi:hypothetical protein